MHMDELLLVPERDAEEDTCFMSERDIEQVMQSKRSPIRRDAVLSLCLSGGNVPLAIQLCSSNSTAAAAAAAAVNCGKVHKLLDSSVQAPAGSEAVYEAVGQLFETCKICVDATKDTRLEPCHHLLCSGCADMVAKHSGGQAPKCPFCRTTITGTGWVCVAGEEETKALPPPPPPRPLPACGYTAECPDNLRVLSQEEELEEEVVDLRVQRASAVQHVPPTGVTETAPAAATPPTTSGRATELWPPQNWRAAGLNAAAQPSGGQPSGVPLPSPRQQLAAAAEAVASGESGSLLSALARTDGRGSSSQHQHQHQHQAWYVASGQMDAPACERLVRESASGSFLVLEPASGSMLHLYANCRGGVVKICPIRATAASAYEFNDTDFASLDHAVQYALLMLNVAA